MQYLRGWNCCKLDYGWHLVMLITKAVIFFVFGPL